MFVLVFEGWKLFILAGQSLGCLQALAVAWLQVSQLSSAIWSERFCDVHGLCCRE